MICVKHNPFILVQKDFHTHFSYAHFFFQTIHVTGYKWVSLITRCRGNSIYVRTLCEILDFTAKNWPSPTEAQKCAISPKIKIFAQQIHQ